MGLVVYAKQEMGFSPFPISLLLLAAVVTLTPPAAHAAFNCSTTTSCSAIIDYVSLNTTTIAAIKTLFGVKNHRSILGVNNLPLSTPPNTTVSAKKTIRVPFPCTCTNGTGISNRLPVYKVVPDDGLFHIAAEVFAGLVTYPEIQAVNNISDPNLIEVGQELWIPLPCSCDDVGGEKVVHYGHVVETGSTVEGIAQEYNTTGGAETLLRLNGLNSSNDLVAGAVLDVPLKACTSMISSDSLDYPLLVANGTYVFTATNCVRCNCDATNNWTLQCMPSPKNSSRWSSCPSMQCQGSDSLFLGNTTTTSNCNQTICAYRGYTNQTILTILASQSTCPVPENDATKLSLQGWRWNFLLVTVHLLLLCLHLFQ